MQSTKDAKFTKVDQDPSSCSFGSFVDNLSPLVFPFAAVVGMPLAKRALLLLAVDPKLNGVLVAAGPGNAKSVLARGLVDLLPASTPFVELPINVAEERLLGGIDLQKTLSFGKRSIEPGLLSQADGGILYVDQLSLLGPRIGHLMFSALDTGICRIEREGISDVARTEFGLVGSYDPSEGEVDGALFDRIGLVVSETETLSLEDRIQVIQRQQLFSTNPIKFFEIFDSETTLLREQIEAAQSRLRRVEISDDDRRRLSITALRYGVEGNRAEIFATRAARANAAFCGRDLVSEEDLKIAVQLVLLPRALADGSQQSTSDQSRSESEPAENRKQRPQQSTNNSASQSQTDIEDVVIDALTSSAPINLDSLQRFLSKENRSGSMKGGQSNRRQKKLQSMSQKRGRHVKSDTRSNGEPKIDLIATLRAAAPYQRLRKVDTKIGDRIVIKRNDLRYKQYKQKVGSLYIFVVDASGSMAVNRINQAKGTLARILEQSYLHRDKVALIAFRKDRAEVLLQPSQSVALAKKSVDALPVGGNTPLAAGLIAALEIAERSQRQGGLQTSLVLFTDGKANAGLNPSQRDRQTIKKELDSIGERIRSLRIPSFVIDTQLRFTSLGEGERLAAAMGGKYVYLPGADSKEILRNIKPNTDAGLNGKV